MNPYESRKLARRIHVDRAKRIESILVRLAANGDLGASPWGPAPENWEQHKVLSRHYVWCDVHCEVHGAKENFYDDGSEYCERENWRSVFVESPDPAEEF